MPRLVQHQNSYSKCHLYNSTWQDLQQSTAPGPQTGKGQFSCSVVSDSLQPHGLQHARLPCLSGACSKSHPYSR